MMTSCCYCSHNQLFGQASQFDRLVLHYIFYIYNLDPNDMQLQTKSPNTFAHICGYNINPKENTQRIFTLLTQLVLTYGVTFIITK